MWFSYFYIVSLLFKAAFSGCCSWNSNPHSLIPNSVGRWMDGWHEWNLYCIKSKMKRIYCILLNFFNFPSSFHLTANIAIWATGMKELTIPYKYTNTKWPRDHSQGEVYDSMSANANSTLSTEHSSLRIWTHASHSVYWFVSLRPSFTSLNGCTLQKTLYSLLY